MALLPLHTVRVSDKEKGRFGAPKKKKKVTVKGPSAWRRRHCLVLGGLAQLGSRRPLPIVRLSSASNCNKSFGNAGALATHVKTHAREDPRPAAAFGWHAAHVRAPHGPDRVTERKD